MKPPLETFPLATATLGVARTPLEDRANWRALDGLRGWAILFVIAVHLWAHSSRTGTGLPLSVHIGTKIIDVTWVFATGHNAVVVFFVLSGFLLYKHWLERQETITLRAQIISFVQSRARRILPAYFFYLALYMLLVAIVGKHRYGADLRAWNFFLNFVFLSPIANVLPTIKPVVTSLDVVPGTWSLNAEMWFYAAMPLLAVLLSRLMSIRWSAWLLLIAALAGPLVRTMMGSNPDWILRYSVFGVFDSFLIGMATAAFFNGYTFHRRWSWLFPLGLVWYVFICAGKSFPLLDYQFQLAVVSGMMILGLIVAPGSLWRASLERNWIVNIGHWSYGLFLSNILICWYVILPISQALKIQSGAQLLALNFFLGIPIMIVLARATYIGFEYACIRRTRPNLRKAIIQVGFVSCSLVAASLVFSVLALTRSGDPEFNVPLSFWLHAK